MSLFNQYLSLTPSQPVCCLQGFSSAPIQSELEVKYETRYLDSNTESSPDAYSRSILNVLRGQPTTFMRSDELIKAWEIFTPVLHQIDDENVKPHIYKVGSRGPAGAKAWISEKSGYVRNDEFVWHNGNIEYLPFLRH